MKQFYILVVSLLMSGLGFGQIISQYVDTDSGTTPKGIEIWNNTGATLDFSTNNLVIKRYANGSSSATTEATISTGTLNAGEVLVIGGSDVSTWMANNYPSVAFFNDSFSFNGDDALEVVYDAITTDVFGTIGQDPGSDWNGGGVSTKDSNIGLLSSISSGTLTGFTDPSTRFEVIEADPSILTGFGVAPVSGPPSTSIAFVGTAATVSEAIGSINLTFSISNPDSDMDTTFDVEISGGSGDATDVDNYITQSVTFPANSSADETLTITVTDDMDIEGDETITFSITNVGGGNNAAVGTNTSFELTIMDNEMAPALTTIAIEDFDNSSPSWANDIADQTFVDPSSPNEGLFIQAASTDNANFSGNSVLGRDLNGEAFEPTLPSPYAFTFEPVNISAFSAVQLSFDYYAFANADYGAYEIILDGVGQGEVTYFDDPDTLPGVNGMVTISIPNGTTTVALLLTGTLDNGSDVIELDNFKIEGVPFDGLTYQDGMWTPSAPDGTTGSENALIVNGEYVLPSDVSLNDVYVNPGAAITVPSGTTLTVASLNLESVSDSYSSLLSNGTINGTVNYSRFVNEVGSGASDGNDLVSPPLTGQTWSDFLSNNTANLVNDGNIAPTTYGFGPFEKLPMNTGFVNYTSDTNAALLSGVGYRSATDAGANLVFTGTVPASPVTAAITQTGNDFVLWNLIGNPFPSYIKLSDFLAVNNAQFENTTAGVYGYDGVNYEVYNQAFSISNPGFLITPGQGFFVSSAALTGTVSFTDAMRSTGSTDDFIVGRAANTASISNLKLQIHTANNQFDTDFYFTSNATRGLDPGYDAAVFGEHAPEFSIYSHLVEDNTGLAFAVQSLTDTDLTDVVVPLGINANQGEQLVFSVAESTLPNGIEVYLEDNVANTMTLLNTGDYTLTPNSALNGIGRFFLRFSNSVLSTPENTLDGLSIYTNQFNKTVVIAGQVSASTTAKVYDLQGRLVTTKILNNNSTNQTIKVTNLSTGIYIVTLDSNNLKKSQKVILR